MCENYFSIYLIPALISGGFTFLGVLIANKALKKNTQRQIDETHEKEELDLYREKIEKLLLLGNKSVIILGQFESLSEDIHANRSIVERNERKLVELRDAYWEMGTISELYFKESIDTTPFIKKILRPIIDLMEFYRTKVEIGQSIDHVEYSKLFNAYLNVFSDDTIYPEIRKQIDAFYQEYILSNKISVKHKNTERPRHRGSGDKIQ